MEVRRLTLVGIISYIMGLILFFPKIINNFYNILINIKYFYITKKLFKIHQNLSINEIHLSRVVSKQLVIKL